jgi:hypothetical protein
MPTSVKRRTWSASLRRCRQVAPGAGRGRPSCGSGWAGPAIHTAVHAQAATRCWKAPRARARRSACCAPRWRSTSSGAAARRPPRPAGPTGDGHANGCAGRVEPGLLPPQYPAVPCRALRCSSACHPSTPFAVCAPSLRTGAGFMMGAVKPRVIYASRTHSQLTQVIRELKATSYRCKGANELCVHRPGRRCSRAARACGHGAGPAVNTKPA